jgi:hypothetical protein
MAKDSFVPSSHLKTRRVEQKENFFFSFFIWIWNFVSQLSGGYRFEVLEKRAMRTRLECNWEEETATLTELCNRKQLDLYCTRNIITMIKLWWGGHVACVGEEGTAYRILVRKRNGKRPIWRKCMWDDNIENWSLKSKIRLSENSLSGWG